MARRTDSAIIPVSAGGIVAILGMLSAFAPMATDMYLPGFHLMAEHFGVAEGGIEVTLPVFFLGLAAGQAVYGPLIDRFGRRGPLLAAVGLYVIATIFCLFTADINTFIALRFLQAVGGCAGMIIGRAIVSDLFDAYESARALSLMMVVMTIAPILAPILGGFIITHAGWKAVFVVMLAFGLVCAALVWFFIPETLPVDRRKKEGIGGVLLTWFRLLSTRSFVVPCVVGGLAQACMFAFITGSPYVFITLHGASAQGYGLLFALIAVALIVFAQANRVALRRRGPAFLLGVALVLNMVAGILCVAAVTTGNLVALLAPLWFAIGALGFIGANAAAVAMRASGGSPGSGSSLIGILQFGFAFIVSSLVAAFQNGTAYPMTAAIATCGTLATLLWFAAGRDHTKHDHASASAD
ncbi:hypothetical protein ACO34A_24485 (plasmid) [Rhizobium sp. ACO-34A]|nr:multidrug effflux MFS transporter [Rhizobium sp. ACO-34A]ATN36934.1 hypothetical protein ACO34A_24485 [Rhizobium sp. ACO-34A]